MKSLNELTIIGARKGLVRKDFSVTELVRACLDRIRAADGTLKAFITVCEKEAQKEAERAEAMTARAKDVKDLYRRKPLLGIPIAVKDNFCTKGVKTTAGSKVLENYLPPYDATVVAKLKAAGAIIIGKTNMDAWAHGASGENSQFGPTKNPWDNSRVAGGSSSGSAAAVASGMAQAATGSDTGGSIRMPANFCNVVGFKPTYGRVSRYGVIAMGSSFDAIGHLARSVEDAALILEVTAGSDSKDATTPPQETDQYLTGFKDDLSRLKIGLPKEYFSKDLDSKIKTVIDRAVKTLRKMGASFSSVSLPHTEYVVPAYYVLVSSEISSNLARYDGLRFGNFRAVFGNEAKRRIMLGTHTLSAGYYDAYYLKAMKVRALITEDFEKAFEKVDLLLTPVSPVLPFKLGEKVEDPIKMYLMDVYTGSINLAGVPAMSLPAGFVTGLPVGMQLIGPQFSELKLLQAAHAYEQATANESWRKLKPKRQ